MKYTFNMCQDTCEPIYFKHGMKLDITICTNLDVHSRSQRYGKARLCSHSVVKLHEAAQMFMMVDYVREMTEKNSRKNGEYGSF